MLSRVADNLYWMARYLERAQHTARLLDVTLDLVPDRSAGAVTRSWEKLFASLHLTIPEGLPLKGRPITQMLALDAESDPSIVHHIASARDNARQVRELISSEMWEQINRLYLDLQKASMDRVWAAPHEFFHAVKQGAHLFQGITDSTMDRGEGWHFIQLGQYIERAGNVAGLLSAHLADEAAGEALPHASDLYLEWLGLLRSCTAFEAYCKVYSADLRFEEIAEFLLLNDSFPFSINFAASMLRIGAGGHCRHHRHPPAQPDPAPNRPAQGHLGLRTDRRATGRRPEHHPAYDPVPVRPNPYGHLPCLHRLPG